MKAELLEDFDMLNIHLSSSMIPTPNSKIFSIFLISNDWVVKYTIIKSKVYDLIKVYDHD